MNKYDALDDEFSYCSTTMEDLRHFKASYPKAEEASFWQAIDLDGDGAPTLYVTSSFEDPSYGFPYVDGAYIRIPKGLEFAEGHYYSNHPTLTGQISQGGKTYDFGGTMHFDIPHLSPFEEEPLIGRIVLLVSSLDDLPDLEEISLCFETSVVSKSDYRFLQLAKNTGKSIKAEYQNEVSSFAGYVQYMSLMPSIVTFSVVIILSAILLFEGRRDAAIASFYARNRFINYLSLLTNWLVIIGAPLILGLIGYGIVSSALRLFISGTLLKGLLSAFGVISLVFSYIENRAMGKNLCRNTL
ncbi:MAG: hypothetical protein J6328_05155 [Bacilli bacterium]|nr:hypothetical protein [Bacilli bacterium]